jgi:chloramphenicol 3-O-phosphotransferase
MLGDPRQQSPEASAPGLGLVIVTGASHTGKSSIIEALLPIVQAPVAVLGVDIVLRETLVKIPGDPWEEIPLAYDLIQAQVKRLLDDDWLVIVESTFTFVPAVGEPEFHDRVLARLLATARNTKRWALVVQAWAPDAVILQRASDGGRLVPVIVTQTARLHAAADMPPGTIRLDTSSAAPDELAKTLLSHVQTARTPDTDL